MSALELGRILSTQRFLGPLHVKSAYFAPDHLLYTVELNKNLTVFLPAEKKKFSCLPMLLIAPLHWHCGENLKVNF